jgi:hypothetical protein
MPSSALGNVQALPASFWVALWNIAGELGTTPQVLGLILFEESGMDPSIINAEGCVGLNQFCPGTFGGYVPMSVQQYAALPAEQQLPYIQKYWADRPSGSLDNVRDLFWVSFLPATWKANASPSTVVNDPSILGASYAATVARQNPGIAQGRATITAGDIDAYLAGVAQAPGWVLALQMLAENDPNADTSETGDGSS